MDQDALQAIVGFNSEPTPVQLMAKPALTVDEFFTSLLGLPSSTMEFILKEPDPPKVFLLGMCYEHKRSC